MTPPERKALSRDQALMWLNDRRGKRVSVSLKADVRNHSLTLFQAAGRLRHWREHVGDTASLSDEAREHFYGLRTDIEGVYSVADAMLDLSEVPVDARIYVRDEVDELRVELSDRIWLSVSGFVVDREGRLSTA